MFPSAFAYASVLLWAVAAGLFAAYAALVAQRVTYVTLADGRRQERRLPLVFRMLLPLAPNVEKLFRGPSFAAVRDRVGAMLASGGFDGLLAPWEYLSLKLLLPLCLGPFWVLAAHLALRGGGPRTAGLFPPVALLGVLLLYMWPLLWLRAAVRRRQTAIVRALPFVLDLLTLSVEAGLDF
ncbi:MAG: hypothetical protein II839_07895, partial [Kiritimatiellae bacterium]|nr:hypothetical protein [Kiritimatiellia bacterium]